MPPKKVAAPPKPHHQPDPYTFIIVDSVVGAFFGNVLEMIKEKIFLA